MTLLRAIAWLVPAALAVGGALVVARTGDVLLLAAGLGSFLLGVAGLFLAEGMPLLAAAQVFLYVGGVLVLVLFALMLLTRDEGGRPVLERRPWLGAATVCGGLFALLAAVVLNGAGAGPAERGGAEAVAVRLLGEWLPAFEALGVLLLAALVAVVAVSGTGGDES